MNRLRFPDQSIQYNKYMNQIETLLIEDLDARFDSFGRAKEDYMEIESWHRIDKIQSLTILANSEKKNHEL